MARRRLGDTSKAPVEHLMDSTAKYTFSLSAVFIGAIITWFGINLGVDLVNYLTENMQDGLEMEYASSGVFLTKIFVISVMSILIFNRTS